MRKFVFAAMVAVSLPLVAALPASAQQKPTGQHTQGQLGQSQPAQSQSGQQLGQSQPGQSQPGQQSMNGNNLDRAQIKQLQQALNQKGFKAGSDDGKIGRETKDALKSFQQKQGLQATGQADQQTLAALGISKGSTTGQAPSGQSQMQKQPSGLGGSMNGQKPGR